MAQSAKDYLTSEKTRLLNQASSLTEKAEKEGRSLATEEKDQIKSFLSQAEEKQSRINEINENEEILASIERVTGPMNKPTTEAKAGARSLGDAFVKSDAFKAMMANGAPSGRWSTGVVEYDTKAAVPLETLTTATGADGISEDVRPGIQANLVRRLTVADLLASGTVSGNSVKIVQQVAEDDTEGGTANNAAAVKETAEKPYSRLALTSVSEPVRKLGHVLAVSDEMLEDVPALRSFIDSQMRLWLQIEEEDQLLNGNGTDPNLSGILDRNIQTADQSTLASNPMDAVYKAISAIRQVFLEPDGIVVNPSDWEIFRLKKDENEQYYGGGPFTGAYGNGGGIAANNLWQLPVVITPAIEEGTVLVGAFRTGAMVFRKGGITVEATNSHEDFFRRNLTAIRAEERLALGVMFPQGFYAITEVSESA